MDLYLEIRYYKLKILFILRNEFIKLIISTNLIK